MNSSVQTGSPCLSGKVIPAQFVRIMDAHKVKSAASGPTPDPETHKHAKITLLKNGETVTTIEIECTCGAVIRLDCEY